MSAVKKIAGLNVIPRGFTVINRGGTNFITPKTRRKKRGLTKAQKAKISAAAKKFKVPVFTAAANMVPIISGVGWLFDKEVGGASMQPPMVKAKTLWNSTMRFYTGVTLEGGNVGFPLKFGSFSLGDAALGLLPNLILAGIKARKMFMGQRNQISKASGGFLSGS